MFAGEGPDDGKKHFPIKPIAAHGERCCRIQQTSNKKKKNFSIMTTDFFSLASNSCSIWKFHRLLNKMDTYWSTAANVSLELVTHTFVHT